MTSLLYVFIVLFATLTSGSALQCYRCQSNQPGCGKEVNIRLQRWWTCPDTGEGGGENFCVKVIKKRGSDEEYIRECLMTLRHNTGIRESLPTVQRHGYCEPARNNNPRDPFNENVIYCFCNDWNGCNTASGIHINIMLSSVISSIVLFCSLW
ncbi:hypothetical protein LSH36_7g17059 [Paralvinella palmiformis]|uniref:Protein sleepless n=1 Tax=Paralvinella palmiformis TaxID=53620 RepID=A0AAD9KEQ2_9ANNE|nr:hypothetical protein LSH36_7g17059 [Paralvinella palmiformis]